MEVNFYGKKIPPPSKLVAESFGSNIEPRPLQGGQGTVYIAGTVVLKPAEENDEWMATIFADLPVSTEVRFARPIRSNKGDWCCEGYVAWSYLEGEHRKGEYQEKLSASRAYHALLQHIEKPEFADDANSSWSAAHQVALGNNPFEYDHEFMELYEQIQQKLQPLDLRSQLIHGDMAGNFLMHPHLPPAIIDFSPAWGPSGLAEGIMLVDIITWESAESSALEPFKAIPEIQQLALRGAIRRIAEQAEHMRFFNKDKSRAVQEARAFQRAIDIIGNGF